MPHSCEQHTNILDLHKEVSQMKQEMAVLKTKQDHITSSLSEIKQSLAIMVTQTANNNTSITNSKSLVTGIIITISVIASILGWVFSNFLGNFLTKGGGK